MKSTAKLTYVLTFTALLLSNNINAERVLKTIRSSSVNSFSTIDDGDFVGKWALDKIVDKNNKVATLPVSKFDLEIMLNGKCKLSYVTPKGTAELTEIPWAPKDLFGVRYAWISKNIFEDAKLEGFSVPFPFSDFTGPLLGPNMVNGVAVFDQLGWVFKFNGQQYTLYLKKI
jgi:hypothetical protein